MGKTTKRTLAALALCLFIVISGKANAQSLQFCEDVSQDGAPINASSVFNIGTNGGYLKCLTTLPYRVGTSSVSYEIYSIDKTGHEVYEGTVNQTVDPSWTWFWKEITFYSDGRYNIIVYDSDKNFLASDQIRIQYY